MSRARELSRVGSLTGISTITGVIHADQENNRFKVGSGVTITTSGNIAAAGIITAASFVGDGSGITNAGSTLSAGSGSQRIVLTSQTTGAMTATSTDSGLTYESGADALTISGGLSVGAAATVGGNLTVTGNLTVDGTTTTVNSTTLTVDDKNIELASTASPSDVTADGGGITLKGDTDHTWNWVNSTDAWTSSEHINVASGKVYRVNGTEVLSSSSLGSGVTGSSLTSVGTITSGVWNGTAITNANLANSTISGTSLGSNLPTATFTTSGTGLSGSATYNGTGSATFTVTSNATSANTASAIVARDGSGNFTAGTITASLSGNADTATTLETARTIALSGDVSGSASFDGSANATITATIADDSHNHIIGNVDGLQSALDLKAPLASPALTGTPTAPTATAGNNTTQVATTAFVSTAVANVIDSAPGALDTLNELAAALGDDANFSSTVTNSLALKAPLASPALTGTPTAPTASANTNTTQVATTAYVQTELLNLDGSRVTSGTVAVARLGSGTPSASNFLRGDGAWTAVPSPNNGTLTLAVSGTGLSGSQTFTADQSSNATFTVTSNATSANAVSTIVARDASGNFNAQDVQVDSFGVGTAASGTTGEIRATNDITAFYSSDERLKENIAPISDALAKLEAISGNTFDWREGFGEFHSHEGADCGVIAQEIEALGIAGLVTTRESGYKAVKYEKLTALLIEAVKELSGKVKHLEERCNCGQAHN